MRFAGRRPEDALEIEPPRLTDLTAPAQRSRPVESKRDPSPGGEPRHE